MHSISRMPAKLLIESFIENAMLMDVSTLDMKLIVNGTKSVIVQRKIPSRRVVENSIFKQRHPKVYLFNKSQGVFGECLCELTFDNINCEEKSGRKSYNAYGIVDKVYRDEYKENPDKFADVIARLNSKINLNGTNLTYEEFRNQVGIGNYIFFVIKELIVYQSPLELDDFYIARMGKNGDFAPSDKYKVPRGWCYVVRKTEENKKLVKQFKEKWE